jgi:hypothetical protein
MSCQGTWKIAPASDYRNKLNQLNDSKVTAQRKIITEKLDGAVCSGINRITIDDLMEENKTELISLGFNVQCQIAGTASSYITIP